MIYRARGTSGSSAFRPRRKLTTGAAACKTFTGASAVSAITYTLGNLSLSLYAAQLMDAVSLHSAHRWKTISGLVTFSANV